MRSPGSTTPYPLQQGQISFISFFDPMISILIWGFVRCSFAFSSQWFLRDKCHSQCNCLKRIKLGCQACFCTSSRLIILSVISQCSISFLYPLPRVIILFCHSHFAGWEVSERFASWAQDGVCRNSKRASSISTHCLSGRKETQKNCHDSRTSTTTTSQVSVDGSEFPQTRSFRHFSWVWGFQTSQMMQDLHVAPFHWRCQALHMFLLTLVC